MLTAFVCLLAVGTMVPGAALAKDDMGGGGGTTPYCSKPASYPVNVWYEQGNLVNYYTVITGGGPFVKPADGSINVQVPRWMVFDENANFGDPGVLPNAVMWRATANKVGIDWASAWVPSAMQVFVSVKDMCFGAIGANWKMLDSWPASGDTYGKTISWTYGVNMGVQSGAANAGFGLSGTESWTQFSRAPIVDRNPKSEGMDSYRLGYTDMAFYVQGGTNSISASGASLIGIPNDPAMRWAGDHYQIQLRLEVYYVKFTAGIATGDFALSHAIVTVGDGAVTIGGDSDGPVILWSGAFVSGPRH